MVKKMDVEAVGRMLDAMRVSSSTNFCCHTKQPQFPYAQTVASRRTLAEGCRLASSSSSLLPPVDAEWLARRETITPARSRPLFPSSLARSSITSSGASSPAAILLRAPAAARRTVYAVSPDSAISNSIRPFRRSVP